MEMGLRVDDVCFHMFRSDIPTSSVAVTTAVWTPFRSSFLDDRSIYTPESLLCPLMMDVHIPRTECSFKSPLIRLHIYKCPSRELTLSLYPHKSHHVPRNVHLFSFQQTSLSQDELAPPYVRLPSTVIILHFDDPSSSEQRDAVLDCVDGVADDEEDEEEADYYYCDDQVAFDHFGAGDVEERVEAVLMVVVKGGGCR